MTLSVAIISPKACVVATDRRIVKGQEVESDEHDKTCVLFTQDATAVVTFCGIAGYGSFDTHAWIVATLERIAPPDYSLAQILTRLTERLYKNNRIGTSIRDSFFYLQQTARLVRSGNEADINPGEAIEVVNMLTMLNHLLKTVRDDLAAGRTAKRGI